jgi:GNAT superfamily N-acetyltransferase
MTGIEIVGALTAGRDETDADARALVFEYMAATMAEITGRAGPAVVDDLPKPLRAECRDLAAVYQDPGTLLVAYAGGEAAGCAGLAYRGERTAEVKRLYVRPARRGCGIARALMARLHSHAATHGIEQVILDVMRSRTQATGFYRRLGYADTEPFPTTSPVPMVYLRRPVGPADVRLP